MVRRGNNRNRTNNNRMMNNKQYVTVRRDKYVNLISGKKQQSQNKRKQPPQQRKQRPMQRPIQQVRTQVFRPTNRKPLRQAARKTNMMNDPYAMCRLTPFQSRGLADGIPDGSDVRKILLDHRMSNTFTFGSSGMFNILITPCIPSSIWFNSMNNDSTFTVNGATYPYNITDFNWLANTIQQPEWRGIPVTLLDQIGKFDNAGSIYNSGKCRLVTVGWSLTFIGTTVQNSGQIQVQSIGLTLGDNIPNMDTFSVYNSQSPSNKSWNNGQVMIRTLNCQPLSDGAMSVETKVIPLRSGAHGVLKHVADEYEWTDVTPNLCFIASPEEERICSLKHNENGTSENVMAHWPHCAAFDDDWSTTKLKITGGTTGASFVLDTIYCVEYVPSITSDTYAIAKGSKSEKPTLLKNVNDAAKSLPIGSIGSAIDVLKTGATIAAAVF